MTTVRKHIDDIPAMSQERAKELEAMSDQDIDYSDIPALNKEAFEKARLVSRQQKTQQTKVLIDPKIVTWFKTHATEEGYQALINDVLRAYIKQNS